MKVTRNGKAKAKKMLEKLISRQEFISRNPSEDDLKLYDMIKEELEEGAKNGFISKITFISKKKTKR